MVKVTGDISWETLMTGKEKMCEIAMFKVTCMAMADAYFSFYSSRYFDLIFNSKSMLHIIMNIVL